MFKVNTYLDRSSTHGIGVFAAEDIPQGTVVWELNPSVDLAYSPEQWQSLRNSITPQSFAALERYSYKENDTYYLCVDNAQFMNHCEVFPNLVNTEDNTLLARCDIRRGNELLCNYFEYSDIDDVHAERLRNVNARPTFLSKEEPKETSQKT